MAIRKLPSKKYGFTYQVDVKYKDPYGITQRHVKSGFRSKREARHHEASVLERASTSVILPKAMGKTLNDVFEEYMDVEGKLKYAPSTKVYYNDTYREYVKDDFGKMPIESINYVNMQKNINVLAKRYNYPTLKNIKKVYAVAFKYAIRVGYVGDNPVPDILLPNKPLAKAEVQTIFDEDFKRLVEGVIKSTDSNNYRARNAVFNYRAYGMALIIGRYAGLRVSEVLGLKKSDFDLENKQLTVQRRVEYARKHSKDIYLTDVLKTQSSKGRVEISGILCDYLKEWFAYNPYDLVICDYKGDLVYPFSMYDRIRKVANELDIDFHFHMLRHTYATELMRAGANPIVVRDLLRHSRVNTTWNVYTHPKREDQRNALDDLYSEDEIDEEEFSLMLK